MSKQRWAIGLLVILLCAAAWGQGRVTSGEVVCPHCHSRLLVTLPVPEPAWVAERRLMLDEQALREAAFAEEQRRRVEREALEIERQKAADQREMGRPAAVTRMPGGPTIYSPPGAVPMRAATQD